jgi:hypothetical protein
MACARATTRIWGSAQGYECQPRRVGGTGAGRGMGGGGEARPGPHLSQQTQSPTTDMAHATRVPTPLACCAHGSLRSVRRGMVYITLPGTHVTLAAEIIKASTPRRAAAPRTPPADDARRDVCRCLQSRVCVCGPSGVRCATPRDARRRTHEHDPHRHTDHCQTVESDHTDRIL